jgi:Smg protein
MDGGGARCGRGVTTPAGREPDGDTPAQAWLARYASSTRRSRRRPREMKESILDVLLYLFEHYFTEDTTPPPGDRMFLDKEQLANGPLVNELTQAGFSPAEIHKAFDWLGALAEQRPEPGTARAGGPTRVYFGAELDKLDVESRGFLLFLEQQGVLDADRRELVLDRAMALDQEELDLEDVKWVVLMVLFNQPGSEAAYAWMETQMFLDEPEPVH